MKIVLNDVVSGSNVTTINSNFDKIEDALNNKVLYRDNPLNEVNVMKNNLDMNGYRIYNLPEPRSSNEPVRLKDLVNLNGNVSNAANVLLTDVANYYLSNNVEGALAELGVINNTITPEKFGAVGDGVADDSVALQAALDAAGSNTLGNGKELLLSGKYKITVPLVFKYTYVNIRGKGSDATQILIPGVGGGCFTVQPGLGLLRPFIRDFSIIGNSSSGHGFDFTNLSVGGQCYRGEIANMQINTGGSGIYAPGKSGLSHFFSMKVSQVGVISYNAHAFHIANGPGTSYINNYAYEVPAGKAGYRMTGPIMLISCNGLNEGDVWGAFGSDLSGSDGFQGDFTFTDYPDINMLVCNVERFSSRTVNGIGIRVCNLYRNFNIIGGAAQRADNTPGFPLGANSYKAIISLKGGSVNSGNPVKVGWAALYLRDVVDGTGTNTPSQAHFYAETSAQFEDVSGVAKDRGILTFRVAGDSLNYPFLSTRTTNDVYAGWSYAPSAINPRRISQKMIRYDTVVRTPVGSNQAIDVTGYTKVIVIPAASATISTATFDTTIGAGTDRDRNGDLIIEAGNSNVTIVHTPSGANTFRTVTGANIVMTPGGIRRFIWSDTSSQWIEV